MPEIFPLNAKNLAEYKDNKRGDLKMKAVL
jgi:hypothetical protein